MRGIAYGVGVGSGDPELMTLKAVRLIKENDVIAAAGADVKKSAAYKIAVKNVPELANKELVPIDMPMVRDAEIMKDRHEKGAKIIESYLSAGRNVVYITLGDPSIYCTFSYLQRILEADGYKTELVSGITSFCAAAARLNLTLAERDEQLHIVPSLHRSEDTLSYDGTYVIMKSGSGMKRVKELLRSSGRRINSVENCGMETEKIYFSADEIPDDAGYFTLIIAKQDGNDIHHNAGNENI